MKNKNLFFPIIALLTLSCSLFEENNEEQKTERLAGVDSLKIVSISDRNVEFTVFCTTPTPCWGFSRFEETMESTDISVKVFIFNTTEEPCITVLGNIQVHIDIQVPTSGTYNFHFFQNDSTTLDTTVTI